MSWQQYVDDSLIATGHVTSAVIIGHDGAMWAQSADLTAVTAAELSAIAAASANPASVAGGKLTLAGIPYMVLRGDESTIYCRKGQTGLSIARSNLAVIVGVYDEKIQAGDCNSAVEKLCDYLKENDY
mmetsp:Transcript_6551/g.15154  ORF Transcript_6551/g.15154 Transcript_6551/m.15154 type:complete len:128 (+) Transcript_6551:54-437(+)|eukprot:CAMPEP_0114539012 /NCGR_PEP_ID=MMETSP0114-20121206/12_1 /TAXON_ID=31324 /ORGANISM="Goniomonas sp, Strain m" /LENGTH=127 /DNA_ID=CAMNT_0001723089 /DNA_START=39 /DNA_END=422 /DNA_ORIENTATION=+